MINRTRQSGFTLVEILVVLFIISIVTSVALLSIRQNENKQMETFANELAQTLMLAEEQAMLQPTVLGLSLGEHSFQFSTYTTASTTASTSEKKSNWLPMEDKVLGMHSIPHNIHVGVEVGNRSKETSTEEKEKNIPQIIISTNGDLTPFVIYVGKKGEKPRYAVRGEADGSITSKALT